MDEVQDDCNDDENNADNRGQTSKDTVGCACLAGAVEGVCGAGYSAQTLLCTMLEQNNNDQDDLSRNLCGRQYDAFLHIYAFLA